MTQSTLIRKLCTYSEHNRTRRAIFEFDRLIRSIYTLRYLRDPQLQRNIHRSQNRIEAYHQLRSILAQIGGKKQLIGRTDLDVAISNQCGRLIANVVIAYFDPVFDAAGPVSSGWQPEGDRPAQENLPSRLAAYPLSRPLHLPWQSTPY